MLTPTLMWLPGAKVAIGASERSRNSRMSAVRSRVATSVADVQVSTKRMRPPLDFRRAHQRQRRQQIKVRAVAQGKAQVARSEPRMLAHDGLCARAFAVL